MTPSLLTSNPAIPQEQADAIISFEGQEAFNGVVAMYESGVMSKEQVSNRAAIAFLSGKTTKDIWGVKLKSNDDDRTSLEDKRMKFWSPTSGD